jgi:hypothetical protein
MTASAIDRNARAAKLEIMGDPVLVREWTAEMFHARVLDLEAKGYVARRETYRITPEMNPETGEVIHLYTIEMFTVER